MARLGVASALVGVAVAGPRWGDERSVVRSRGIDMCLALDASLSMMAQDERPSRLERMKEEVRRLRARVAGRSDVRARLRRAQLRAVAAHDRRGRARSLPRQSRSVGRGPGRQLDGADDSPGRGLAHADEQWRGSRASRHERWRGVRADGGHSRPKRSGRGSRASASSPSDSARRRAPRSPIKQPDGSTTLKKDENGNTVVTQYHPETLKAAADAAGGTFIPADATDKASRVKAALSTLRTQSRASLGAREQDAALPVVPVPGIRAACCSIRCCSSGADAGGRAPPRRIPRPPHPCCSCCRSTAASDLTRTQQAVAAYHHESVHAVGVAVPRRDHGGRQDRGDALQLRHGARRGRFDVERRRGARARRSTRRPTKCASGRCSTSVSRI